MRARIILTLTAGFLLCAMQSQRGSTTVTDVDTSTTTVGVTLTAIGDDGLQSPKNPFNLSKQDVAAFVRDKDYRTYPLALLDPWDRDLKQAVRKKSLDAAADTLAGKYGLSSANMRELVRLWITAQARQYDMSVDKSFPERVETRFLALLRATDRAPLVLEVAGAALDDLDQTSTVSTCGAMHFDRLLAGSQHPAQDAWRLANASVCGDHFLAFLKHAPGNMMPGLIRLADYGTLKPIDALPLYTWLISDAARMHIAPQDRETLSATLYRRYATLLFQNGPIDRAVAMIDGLSPAMRAQVLAPAAPGYTATVDGLPVAIKAEQPGHKLRLNLAAAYALAGRDADAQTMLASIPDMAAVREAFACATTPDAPNRKTGCRGRWPTEMKAMIVDFYLHHHGEDPYLLAETFWASGDVSGDGGLALNDLGCRLLAPEQYPGVCESGHRGDIYVSAGDVAREQRARKELAALPDLDFETRRASFAPAFPRLAAKLDGLQLEDGEVDYRRNTIVAEPPPFAQHPLPARFITAKHATVSPDGMAKLPDGFLPLRFERDGKRAIAISVSQNLDPTGEVSRGGYWVHLSSDGGKTWQAPLYTGLADRFPYVVVENSAMPLLDGDTINLEVAVNEIDTASITYPPVALTSRRKAKNLYLAIPIATLKRDSNGDGITDLVAHHLLLDQPKDVGGTPFIVGTTPPSQCVRPPSLIARARLALLNKLFDSKSRAIVEPVDRQADHLPIIGGWQSAAQGMDRPILLTGDPADYACIRSSRLMVVYSKADVAQIEHFTPDFHTVVLPPIVFNRAHDRGYVKWSTGWAGGTYRLLLVNGVWQFDEISSWIT